MSLPSDIRCHEAWLYGSFLDSHESNCADLIRQSSQRRPGRTGYLRFQRTMTTGRTGIEVINARHQHIATGRHGLGPVAGGAVVGTWAWWNRHRFFI